MSVAAIQSYLEESGMPQIISGISNGEFRVMANSAGDTVDSRGFPTPGYSAATPTFIPCVWEIKYERDAREEIVAGSPRGIAEYHLICPRRHNNADVVIGSDDRIELKREIGGSVITLEMSAPINRSGAFWEVIATNINAE